MTMTVTALGTGDAFSALRYSSCLLVETTTTKVLVDCPHPIRKMLRESTAGRVDVADIDAVIITHLHADHASGLEGFLWFARFALQRTARVYASAAVGKVLWQQLMPSMGELLHVDDNNHPTHRQHLHAEDLFEFTPLDDQVIIGDIAITSRPTIHHVPTTALRLRGPTHTLGYSADTAFDPSLLEWLDSSDVILHETNYGAHTPYAKLAALPKALRDKMRLIHWPDGFAVEDSNIAVLHDGDVLTLG